MGEMSWQYKNAEYEYEKTNVNNEKRELRTLKPPWYSTEAQ
jgi:hypothetical protein